MAKIKQKPIVNTLVDQVGPTEFTLPETDGVETDLPIETSQTVVKFSRVDATKIMMTISVVFTPASIATAPPLPHADAYSVIDFVNTDVYVSGAPQSLTTRFNSVGQAVFNFTADTLTVISRRKDSFG